MTENDYGRQKAEAETLAAFEAGLDPALAEPAPADLEIDRNRVDIGIQAGLVGQPELRQAWEDGLLNYGLSGFDDKGWGQIVVFRSDTGEEVGGARVHWTAVARHDD
jgi:hypothetical protein